MNQNNMDRYYWRTGQKWSGDSRSEDELSGPRMTFPRWTVVFLIAAFIGTSVALLMWR
jgi:hypothetical protein